MTGLSGAHIIQRNLQQRKDAELEGKTKVGSGKDTSSKVKGTQLPT